MVIKVEYDEQRLSWKVSICNKSYYTLFNGIFNNTPTVFPCG